MAHVGVLKVLEELRIPVDYIVGNSMGSLVAGTYAYGYSPTEQDDILTTIDWRDVMNDGFRRRDLVFRRKQDDLNFLMKIALGFRDWDFRFPKGLLYGQRSSNILRFLTPGSYKITHFDQLNIPFRAVATEIGTGKEIVLESGSLPVAMSASMAIPGAFAPVNIDGRDLVDGMVVNNIPIDLVRQMGAEVVIAIDIGTPLMKAEDIQGLLQVTGQMVSILMQKNVDAQLATLTEQDTLIVPELGDIKSTSFGRGREAIDIGYRAASAMRGELRRYSVPEEEFREFLRKQRRNPEVYPVIDRLKVVNNSRLADGVITEMMDTQEGEVFDPDVLAADIHRVHGRDDFEMVTFELEEINGETELRLIADEKSWGPNYIKLGINIEDDFDGETAYNLAIQYTMRNMNALGGEWRHQAQIGNNRLFFTEFYQPLDEAQRFFVAPRLEWQEDDVDIYDRGTKTDNFDVEFGTLAFDIGTNIGNWAELRFGIRRIDGHVDVKLSSTGITDFDFDDGLIGAALNVDTLDNPYFPTEGGFGVAEWLMAMDSLGADEEYQRLNFRYLHSFTFGELNTILLTAQFGTVTEKSLPIYRLHRRGGFLDISGLSENELAGQHTITARMIFYRRIAGVPFQTFGMPIYLGGSFESGQVYQDRDDIFNDLIYSGSAFLGIDSPIGPVYLGYGLAEGGNDTGYLFVGRSF
jgi:NTE family protein